MSKGLGVKNKGEKVKGQSWRVRGDELVLIGEVTIVTRRWGEEEGRR